jgi:hypothetical protein
MTAGQLGVLGVLIVFCFDVDNEARGPTCAGREQTITTLTRSEREQ